MLIYFFCCFFIFLFLIVHLFSLFFFNMFLSFCYVFFPVFSVFFGFSSVFLVFLYFPFILLRLLLSFQCFPRFFICFSCFFVLSVMLRNMLQDSSGVASKFPTMIWTRSARWNPNALIPDVENFMPWQCPAHIARRPHHLIVEVAKICTWERCECLIPPFWRSASVSGWCERKIAHPSIQRHPNNGRSSPCRLIWSNLRCQTVLVNKIYWLLHDCNGCKEAACSILWFILRNIHVCVNHCGIRCGVPLQNIPVSEQSQLSGHRGPTCLH